MQSTQIKPRSPRVSRVALIAAAGLALGLFASGAASAQGTIMTNITAATLLPAMPMTAGAQVHSEDEVLVRAWLDNFASSWAAGDAERMFSMATDDVEWVNIVGMHWRGKAHVVAVHRAYLNTMFRGVPLTLKSVESIRPIGPDVVVAVVRWSVGQFSPPDGSTVPAADDRMTLVFHRTAQGLALAHGANVQINQAALDSEQAAAPQASRRP